MGSAKVYSQYIDSDGSSQITGVALGYGFVVGVFLKGEIDTIGICMNEADFRKQYGDLPVTGYENDYYNCIEFFRHCVANGVTWGKLMVCRTAHHNEDGSLATAAKGAYSCLDSTSAVTFIVSDKYERESPFSVKVVAGTSDATNLRDLIVYEDDEVFDRIKNFNMDPTSPNYIVTQAAGKEYEITDSLTGILPAVMGSASDLTGGSDGLAEFATTDLIGGEYSGGNTGMYTILDYVQTKYKPEYMMIPYASSGVYAATKQALAKSMETFAISYGMIPIHGTPAGLDRLTYKQYAEATDDYDAGSALGDATGGTLVEWPHYTPPYLMNSSPRTHISPEGTKMGLLMAVIGRSWIHQSAAGFEDGRVIASELEIKTKEADSELLDDLGLQVIRKDKGMIFDSHQSRSSNPNFADESVRRRENYCNHSINLSTQAMLHKPLTVSRCRQLEANMKTFFMNLFKSYPEAFVYETFEENVTIDVVGQNIPDSPDWREGKLYTYRKIAWSRAIQEIVHRWAHTSTSSSVVE
jgi:hypothetical protein